MDPNGITRREMLAALLGVPAALAACHAKETSPFPPGELVGTSHAIGHRLLAPGLKVTPPSDRWERAGVVIVSGGVAGLSAVWRLLKAGFEDFVLIELEPAPGGTSRSGTGFPGQWLDIVGLRHCATTRDWIP